MAVWSAPWKPSWSGGAVAGVVSSRTIAVGAWAALRWVRVRSRTRPCGSLYAFARRIWRSNRARVRVTVTVRRRFCCRTIRIGILFFSGTMATVWGIPHYVVSWTLQKTRAIVKQSLTYDTYTRASTRFAVI